MDGRGGVKKAVSMGARHDLQLPRANAKTDGGCAESSGFRSSFKGCHEYVDILTLMYSVNTVTLDKLSGL